MTVVGCCWRPEFPDRLVVWSLRVRQLPLFEAMREQQKWIALVLLGYAVAFGVSVEWFVARVADRSALLALPLALAPVVIAPTLVWGSAEHLHQPLSRGLVAGELTHGLRRRLALFLPWHAYQPFGFSDDRTIATPANAFFDRTALTSDAVELPGLRTDSTSCARRTWTGWWPMAGVTRSVVWWLRSVSNTSCSPRPPELPDYGWVRRQPDLALVLDTATMAVYRVEARGTGRVVARRSATYEQTLQWAAAGSWAPRRSRPREVSTGAAVKPPEVCASSATRW